MNQSITKMAKKKTKMDVLPSRQKEPEYTIQLADPKMLRKDILEGLRDVILFMQCYEKFRKIQAEKVATFHTLAVQLKGVRSLIDSKLSKYLPKGKLHPIKKIPQMNMQPQQEETGMVMQQPERTRNVPAQELDELESQLREIESQL